jgi:glycerophosphoryl diester phosphodiesterase
VLVALISTFVLIPRGHSHNDYLRERPLFEALDAGFCSVEADVFLVDGRLLVAHERRTLSPDRTLQKLYLEPLAKRIRENKGWVYEGQEQTFWVLIDIKAEGAAAYVQLRREIQQHPELAWNPGQPAVRFVISGDRPIADLVRDEGKFAALDGRWGDLERGFSPEFMPWVSEAWFSHFKWAGGGDFEEASKLRLMTEQVHSQGRKIRFWGAPDGPGIWRAHWEAGVDFINTDRPATLREFVLNLTR